MQASKILIAGLLGGTFAISAQACFPCPPKVCCPICISQDGGGSQTGHSKFVAMLQQKTMDIRRIIEKTIKEQDKINKLQGVKLVDSAAMQRKYELMVFQLNKQNYELEKTTNLKCINIDAEINKLNAKIMESEILVMSLKSKK